MDKNKNLIIKDMCHLDELSFEDVSDVESKWEAESCNSQQQNKHVNRILFLTEEGSKQLAAQDGRHFAHAVLQGLLVWTGQVSLVLSEEPYRSLCVCLQNRCTSCQTWKHAQLIHCIPKDS